MPSLLKTNRRGKPRKGALTLEWIVIVTVLVIGVIGGLGVVRKAVVEEMADMAESIGSLQIKTQAEISAEGGSFGLGAGDGGGISGSGASAGGESDTGEGNSNNGNNGNAYAYGHDEGHANINSDGNGNGYGNGNGNH